MRSNRTSRSSTDNSSVTTGPSTSSHKRYGNEGNHSSDYVRIEPADKVKMEFQRYLSDVVTDQFDANGNLDPLQWWKLNATRYPCVSVLARKYLAIPATSVPSERAFSLTGHLVNEKEQLFCQEQ